jgi:hypothetical protein
MISLSGIQIIIIIIALITVFIKAISVTGCGGL